MVRCRRPSMPVRRAWRLAAAADGLDSLLYLGLLDGEGARELMRGSIRRELTTA